MYSAHPLSMAFLSMVHLVTVAGVPVTKLVNAVYSKGSPFSRSNMTTADACLCSCSAHPHCLSISVAQLTSSVYLCQLFATYPKTGAHLSASSTSNVTVYTDRTLNSVYVYNGSALSNPQSLFANSTDPWIPAFAIYAGNGQSFLWMNSSNLTTLTSIPRVQTNQSSRHWFSIMVSQWNQGLFVPNQVALAFIVNRTTVFEFLTFNTSQSDIRSWFTISRFISARIWVVEDYRNRSEGQQLQAVYTDTTCTRSFNCNFKYPNTCSSDFYGFFFVYGGYFDSCIAAVRNISQVPVPSIFYDPNSAFTNGNLTYYKLADGLMGFFR